VSSQRADDRPLSEDQAKELRRAALANAEALTSDARLLLDGNRFPRAGAVAIMVHEELAKWIALYTFSLRIVAGSTMDWTSFWNSWTNHRFKLELGIGADQTRAWYQKNQGTIPADQVQNVVAQAQEAIDKWVKQVRDLRMAGFYVDFDGGDIRTPERLIDAEEARQLVGAARHNCAFYRQVETLTGDQLSQFVEDPQLRPFVQPFLDRDPFAP
jgi:AbiV family abortive infection protein